MTWDLDSSEVDVVSFTVALSACANMAPWDMVLALLASMEGYKAPNDGNWCSVSLTASNIHQYPMCKIEMSFGCM